MADQWKNEAVGQSDPITRSVAVVPHDVNEFDVTRGLFVQTGGALVVRLRDDTTDWTLTVPSQSQLSYRVRAVRATGTTATGIRALY